MECKEIAGREQYSTGAAASMPQPRSAPVYATHRWLFRWPPLLYTAFWFITPWYRHSNVSWAIFALFYASFLIAYFQTFTMSLRRRRIGLAVMFLMGYLYFPFSQSAAGEFVYPVVMSVYFLRQPKLSSALWRFAAIELAQALGVLLETSVLHLNLGLAETVIFYSVAIGLSNFAYSRHLLASEQLERANLEIEHLTQVAERERIARDLHDLLGHTLTVIVLKSDVANRLFATHPELAHQEIAEVETTARKALAEIREAVAGYRGEGLPAEVARTRRALTSAGVQLTTNLEYIVPLPVDTTILCLVLREAVTNVIRHSGATVCRLELHREGDRLTMSIEDNGSGELNPEGNGLRGMRERLASAGGILRRERSADGGTRLAAEIPLPALATQDAAAVPPERTEAAFVAINERPVSA